MMFICLRKDKWVQARCQHCPDSCGIGHQVTQEHGTRLFGQGFDQRKPAVGKGLVAEGSDPQ